MARQYRDGESVGPVENPPAALHRDRIRRAIARWQAGVEREASFRTLVESYYRSVHYYFVQRGFSADEAGDLTQETFFGIYKGLASFRGEARFDTWLYQIAANTCRKTWRDRHAKKRRLELEAKSMTDLPGDPAPPEPASDPAALDDVLLRERRQRLRRAIAALPVKMRACLTMRIYQELSYQEIAVAMQLSVETVKAHLYQARQRLRQELSEDATSARRARQAMKETR